MPRPGDRQPAETGVFVVNIDHGIEFQGFAAPEVAFELLDGLVHLMYGSGVCGGRITNTLSN